VVDRKKQSFIGSGNPIPEPTKILRVDTKVYPYIDSLSFSRRGLGEVMEKALGSNTQGYPTTCNL